MQQIVPTSIVCIHGHTPPFLISTVNMECVLLAIASSILSGTALSAAIVVAGSKLGADGVSPNNNSEPSTTLVNAMESSSQSVVVKEDTMEVALESASSQDSSSRSNISSSLSLFAEFVRQWNVWQRQIMGCHRSVNNTVDSGSDRLKGRETHKVDDDDDDDESFESLDLADALPPHEEEDGCFDKSNSILATPPFKAFAIPSRVRPSLFVIPKLPDKPTPSDFDDNDSFTLCKKNR